MSVYAIVLKKMDTYIISVFILTFVKSDESKLKLQ